MAEEIDWSLTTFEGLRRKQRLEFVALSFEEKLERLEQMSEIAEMFEANRQVERNPGAAVNPKTSTKPQQ
ncbi:MAG: hypothetical protein JNK16_13875 [Phycisphaerales bacterium]|nr:hypothetical protein [Phycisphaerales bacterium]